MSRLKAPDGTPLSVFTDGEVVFEFENGEEAVESFENLGQEMELDMSDIEPALRSQVTKVTFRQTDAKVAKSREVVENE